MSDAVNIDSLPPHMQRVSVELQELSSKIESLSAFITASDMFSRLTELDKSLLLTQLSCMHAYGHILLMRLKQVA